MDPAALGRQQISFEHLAQQRVARAERTRRWIGDEDARRHGGPDRFADRRLVPLRDGGHQALVDRSSGDRDDAQQSLAFVGQRGDLAGQRLGQGPRQWPRPAATLDADQLLHEEGVAARSRVDPVDLGLVDKAAKDRRDLSSHVPTIEPLQVQAARPGIALEFGQPGGDRIAVHPPVGPHGQHEQQSVALEVAGEEGDQVACPTVDPVEILEHQQCGCFGAEVGQQAEDEPEQACLAKTRSRVGGEPAIDRRGDRTDAGQEPADLVARRSEDRGDPVRRQVAQEAPQRLRQCGIGQAVIGQIETAADEHTRTAIPGAADEFLDQPRLADAGLARDHDDARLAVLGTRERGLERGELRLPPDQFRTRHEADHRASLRAVRLFEVPALSRMRPRPMAPALARPTLASAGRWTAGRTRRRPMRALYLFLDRTTGVGRPRHTEDEPLAPIKPGAFAAWMASHASQPVDARTAKADAAKGRAKQRAERATGTGA